MREHIKTLFVFLPGELMPTTVRAAGVGSSSLVSKIGGTLSTTVAALADIHPAIPTIIFAAMAITSGGLTVVLPETKGRKMPELLEDVEREKLCAHYEKTGPSWLRRITRETETPS